MIVALGLGGLFAYLLSGPLAGASATPPPPAQRPKQTAPPEGKLTAATQKSTQTPQPPLVAPGAPTAATPRKATQTAQKFK